MQRQEESIYNLVTVPPEEASKPPLYRSRHNGALPPSYSTFGLQNTNKLVTNTMGELEGGRPQKKSHATMGTVVAGSVDPKQFMRKGSPQKTSPAVATVSKEHSRAHSLPRKAPVPAKDDKPIMGLKSDKNFVVANSVENIISVPKKKVVEPVSAVARSTYGKVPKYLESIKEHINQEKDFIEQTHLMNQQHQLPPFMREVDEAEKREMLAALKAKYEEKQKTYYALPFSKDTATQITRKEQLEKEMASIETALKKLENEVVLVYSDLNKNSAMFAREFALKEAQKLSKTRKPSA